MREAGAVLAPAVSPATNGCRGTLSPHCAVNPYLKLWTVTREEAGPDANRGSS